MTWISYNDHPPLNAGVYEWRMPSEVCKGLFVTLHDHFRLRGAGYKDVLSPSFDHWDGYHVLVPAGLEWRPSDKELKRNESTQAIPEGVELDPCPFCKKIPTWRSNESSGWGVVVNARPQRLNNWWILCCAWAQSPKYKDPRDLARTRLELLTINSRMGQVIAKRDTQDFVFKDTLISHCGEMLTPEKVDEISAQLIHEATEGGCAWAFE